MPNLASTAQSTSRGTESKALTRSTNSTHDSSPCSRRRLSACRRLKGPSEHPRPPVKPFCASRPSSLSTRSRRFAMIIETSLEAASSSMMPRQLFKSWRSPFFGNIFSRMVTHSFSMQTTVSGASGVVAAASSFESEFGKMRK